MTKKEFINKWNSCIVGGSMEEDMYVLLESVLERILSHSFELYDDVLRREDVDVVDIKAVFEELGVMPKKPEF